MLSQTKKALIVQGGGFRTAFSAGVLDVFMQQNYNPFDMYIGVSGGAIAASYYVSNQPFLCFDAMKHLCVKEPFIKFSRVLKSQPIMNVDVFYDISNKHMPFDFDKALENLNNKQMAIVMTDMKTGKPYYHHPTKENWQDAVIASCSLPFVSKGKHMLEGREYMDGDWSDPLPVMWALEQGVTEITLLMTLPNDVKKTQGWVDRIGEFYHRKSPLKKAFAENHKNYNQAIEFIHSTEHSIKIHRISPSKKLKSQVYSDSIPLISHDYQYGKQVGEEFLKSQIY
jgi:predicted patatin/cPLA2 family phospholipase